MKQRRLIPAVFFLIAVAIFRSARQHPESGPILQRVAAHSAIVLQHTGFEGPRYLRYRRSDTSEAWQELGETAEAKDRPRLRHLFRLTGLAPDTSYDYEIFARASAASASTGGSFKTAPLPGQGRVRFAAFGDSGKIPWWSYSAQSLGLDIAEWLKDSLPGRGQQWDIARGIVARKVDLVLHLGDLVYPWGRREDYEEAVFLPFEELLSHAAFYPSVGNHDLLSQGGKWLTYFFEAPLKDGASGGRYYSFVHGPVQFICLDTFSPGCPLVKGARQWQWLERLLAKRSTPWRVVFTHRPVWTASRSRADSENARLRKELHPLFAKSGIDVVFSGHDHLYERYKAKDGVHYVVAGGGGKSLYELSEDADMAHSDNEQFGFVFVEATAARFELHFVSQSGVASDALNMAR